MFQRLQGNEKDLVGYWRLDDGGQNNQEVINFVTNSAGKMNKPGRWVP